MLRIVIAGSRYFNDYKTLEKVVIKKLFELNKTYPQLNLLTIDRNNSLYKINRENLEIISGMASGADSLAVKFAHSHALKLVEFPADWKNLDAKPCKIMKNSHGEYNALAGHNRNRAMAEYATSDDNFGVLILFWDGKSKGSKNMKSQATNYKMKIFEHLTTKENKGMTEYL